VLPHATPLPSCGVVIVRVRVILPTPNGLEQLPQALHSVTTQSTSVGRRGQWGTHMLLQAFSGEGGKCISQGNRIDCKGKTVIVGWPLLAASLHCVGCGFWFPHHPAKQGPVAVHALGKQMKNRRICHGLDCKEMQFLVQALCLKCSERAQVAYGTGPRHLNRKNLFCGSRIAINSVW
jgi:hypothetical protein